MSDANPTGMRKGLTRYGDEAFSLFLRKAFIKSMGYSDDALDRPLVGVTNTFSGYNACHQTVPALIEAVKRGVMLAGGLPVPSRCTSPSPTPPACSTATSWPWTPKRCCARSRWTRRC